MYKNKYNVKKNDVNQKIFIYLFLPLSDKIVVTLA